MSAGELCPGDQLELCTAPTKGGVIYVTGDIDAATFIEDGVPALGRLVAAIDMAEPFLEHEAWIQLRSKAVNAYLDALAVRMKIYDQAAADTKSQ